MNSKNIEDKILEYLKKDKRGYRLPLLKILSDGKSKTIREIHSNLNLAARETFNILATLRQRSYLFRSGKEDSLAKLYVQFLANSQLRCFVVRFFIR